MLRQAVSLGLTNFSFVDAVSATKLDLHQLQQDGDYDEAAAIKLHGRPLTRGEIACSLSHGQVYERILAEGHPFALVLEDDALFISHRLQRVRLADFPIGIDVIFLNFFRSVEPPRGRISGSIFSDASYEGSSAAYIVTRSGAEKLARAYRPVVHAADGLLGRSLAHLDGVPQSFRQQGTSIEMAAYLVYPDCVLNGSDLRFVQTTLTPDSCS